MRPGQSFGLAVRGLGRNPAYPLLMQAAPGVLGLGGHLAIHKLKDACRTGLSAAIGQNESVIQGSPPADYAAHRESLGVGLRDVRSLNGVPATGALTRLRRCFSYKK